MQKIGLLEAASLREVDLLIDPPVGVGVMGHLARHELILDQAAPQGSGVVVIPR